MNLTVCVVGTGKAFDSWKCGLRDTFPGIPLKISPGRVSFIGLENVTYKHVFERHQIRGLQVAGAIYLHDAYSIRGIDEMMLEIRIRTIQLPPGTPHFPTPLSPFLP